MYLIEELIRTFLHWYGYVVARRRVPAMTRALLDPVFTTQERRWAAGLAGLAWLFSAALVIVMIGWCVG